MKNTEFWRVNKLLKLIINLKEVILSVSLVMCDTELLTTEIKKSINTYKSEIELKKKSVCYFINLYCFLLLLIISFLLRGNFITSVIINLLLCQL